MSLDTLLNPGKFFRKSRYPYRLGIITSVISLLAASAYLKADPVVDIEENDGVPMYYGNKLIWDYNVKNNSDIEPVGNPYNEKISQVLLYDLFSVSPPTFGTLPSAWTGTVANGSAPDLWNITMSTSFSPALINPGGNKDFPVETYVSDPSQLATGTLYGQGLTQGHGLQPPLPGDTFIGPINPILAIDVDANGVIDDIDYAAFEACSTGPDVSYQNNLPIGCEYQPDDSGYIAVDVDKDWDVDSSDFGHFQRCDNRYSPDCLQMEPVKGDLDMDRDVDLADFSDFATCFNGPNRPYRLIGCGSADHDSDSDVDLSDFALFANCFNGPNRPPGC